MVEDLWKEEPEVMVERAVFGRAPRDRNAGVFPKSGAKTGVLTLLALMGV